VKKLGSFNEWDPLYEVVVGRVENARFPSFDQILRRSIPQEALCDYDKLFGNNGDAIPLEIVSRAQDDLDTFISILVKEGVKVLRPEVSDFSKGFSTPEWYVKSSVSTANPRDVFLVIGDLIIECPMADRGRYYEAFPYRKILLELHSRGFRWISAPKPQLDQSSYSSSGKFCVSDSEPLFDAADFVRCGKLIIGQLSHVTNQKGIDWLRSILPAGFELKIIDSLCEGALHIDTTIIPLEDGLLLVNPDFVDPQSLSCLLPEWQILIAPRPHSFYTTIGGYRIVSDWMSINLLGIGNKKLIVEEKQKKLQEMLSLNGFEIITCPFESYYIFGGSFHCATLDVQRGSN